MTGGPRSRSEAITLAETALRRFEEALSARSAGRLLGKPEAAERSPALITSARQHLRQVAADLLQAPPRAPSPLEVVGALARGRAWDVEQRLSERVHALRGLGHFVSGEVEGSARRPSPQRSPGRSRRDDARGRAAPPPSPDAPARVLAVPRTHHHLRDQRLVALAAAERGDVDVVFLTFTEAHTRALRSAGLCAALAGAFSAPRAARVLVLRAELALAAVSVRADPPDGLADRWGELVAALHRELQAQVEPAMIAALAMERAIDELAPSVVLAGNPVTLEGAIAVEAAHARGLPAATMQHGDFSPAHREWAESEVDLITTWGEGPSEVLAGLGVGRDRIAVTGAPWADHLSTSAPSGARARGGPRARVLVATSGAGHSVGLPEHEAHVRRLLAASAALPDVDLVFRLHPKDRRPLYDRLLAEVPGARATILEPKDAGDIHRALPDFALLITVTSTSAIDAMLHGVPVIALARPAGEPEPAFVRAGAARVAGAKEELADAIRSVLAEGAGAEQSARAAAYVERFFGARDGGAAERVLEALIALGRRPRG